MRLLKRFFPDRDVCAWCDGKPPDGDRHDMCTGVAVTPAVELLRGATTKPCRCAAEGHRPQ